METQDPLPAQLPMVKLTFVSLILAAGAIFAYARLLPDDRITLALARLFRQFSRHRTLACLVPAILVLIVRAALLPVWPIPRPAIYDEFSYLLQADTFAHRRLTNPPHPLWQFFESIYILQQPTYASKYPPGQALVMAAGQRLFGDPWYGVWLSCGVLAAMLCWALQGWLPPPWALLGTLIATNLCMFSYWMNSYWGGAVAGIGGALVTGSWPRIVRARRTGNAWFFGAGAAILLLTRPFEGFLLVAPASLALWINVKRVRIWLPIVAVGAAGLGWQAFYDYRVTGHPLRMPYQEYFAQYESVPPLNILPVQPRKEFRHFDLEFLDSGWTRDMNARARSWQLPLIRAADFERTARMMFGHPLWLVILVAFAPVWFRSRRIRLPLILACVMAGGAMFELIYYVHYAAPIMAVLLILLLQSLRVFRAWSARYLAVGKQGGTFAVLALLCSFAGPAAVVEVSHIYRHTTPDQIRPRNARKGTIEKDLLRNHPGRHVIFVRYTGVQKPHEEWIYNPSNIAGAPVIWAQDMGSENERLMAYYRGRMFWIFEPDIDPVRLHPFTPA